MASINVLIVDDNATNLKLAKVVLTAAGFTVATAVDAEAALAILESSEPAVVLMDIQLPGMDGLELTRRLKRDPKHAGMRIIALTAYAMLGDETQALAAGCDGYITKPIDTRTIARTVEQQVQAAWRREEVT